MIQASEVGRHAKRLAERRRIEDVHEVCPAPFSQIPRPAVLGAYASSSTYRALDDTPCSTVDDYVGRFLQVSTAQAPSTVGS